jgi:hypothetical protein
MFPVYMSYMLNKQKLPIAFVIRGTVLQNTAVQELNHFLMLLFVRSLGFLTHGWERKCVHVSDWWMVPGSQLIK